MLPAMGQSCIDPAPSPSSRPGGKATILLVEDEELVRAITRISLTRAGYEVIEAANAEAASRLWHENARSIDLLLADIQLGEGGPTGLDLAESLHYSDAELRILITTGRSIAHLETPFYCHMLQKPFDLAQLATTLRCILDEVAEERTSV